MTFNIYQLDHLAYDEAELLLEDYQDELVEQFVESVEGKTYLDKHSGLGGWISHLIDYAYNYEGVSLPQMSADEVQIVLEELFPRKITLFSPEDAEEVIPELRAFWQFLKREYQLSQAYISLPIPYFSDALSSPLPPIEVPYRVIIQ
jgi:hypothetical protein